PTSSAHQHCLDFNRTARTLRAAGSIYRLGSADCRNYDGAEPGGSALIGAGEQAFAACHVGGGCGLCCACNAVPLRLPRMEWAILDPAVLRSKDVQFAQNLDGHVVCS